MFAGVQATPSVTWVIKDCTIRIWEVFLSVHFPRQCLIITLAGEELGGRGEVVYH